MHFKTNKKLPVWVVMILLLIVFAVIFLIYCSDYYHTDSAYLSLLDNSSISVKDTDFGWFLDGPSNDKALIFYPGAKVEASAYKPFLSILAENGIDIFLVKMPFNLAVFGMKYASEIIDSYSYDRWYIGGHSLGGAVAANYASAYPESLDGIILLAAYSTKELDPELLEILIYGSQDTVLNMGKVQDGRTYAPQHYIEYVIDGGNHAQFGNYGIQKGDGEATISADDQQRTAAAVILENIG